MNKLLTIKDNEIVFVYCYACGAENDTEATECENCKKTDALVPVSREPKDEIILQMIEHREVDRESRF